MLCQAFSEMLCHMFGQRLQHIFIWALKQKFLRPLAQCNVTLTVHLQSVFHVATDSRSDSQTNVRLDIKIIPMADIFLMQVRHWVTLSFSQDLGQICVRMWRQIFSWNLGQVFNQIVWCSWELWENILFDEYFSFYCLDIHILTNRVLITVQMMLATG